MNTHKSLKIVLSFAAALVMTIIGLNLTTETASAHTLCRINGPFGTWTEGCPHVHAPQEPGYTLPVLPDTRRNVRVQNNCSDTLRVSLLYRDEVGNYETAGSWRVTGNSTSGNLAHGGDRLRVEPTATLYYHASSDRFNWRGDIYRTLNSSNLGFREYGTLSHQGDHVLMTLRCNGSHIGWGDTRTATLSLDSSHRWTFDATAGIWTEINMTSDNMDTYLELLGPNGQMVAFDVDGGEGRNARIYVDSLPQTGTYTIVAKGFMGETGSYVLTLE